jgi:hypothetical protein
LRHGNLRLLDGEIFCNLHVRALHNLVNDLLLLLLLDGFARNVFRRLRWSERIRLLSAFTD